MAARLMAKKLSRLASQAVKDCLNIVGFLRYCDIVIISDDNLKNNGMSLAKKFAYNSLIQFIGKALSVALGLLGVALITRYLGVIGFGRYVTLNNFLGIFAVLADLGLTMVTAQMINERPAERQKILNNLCGFRLLSAGLILFSGLLVAGMMPYYRDLWLILAVLAISYFLIAINQVFVGFLQSELRSDYLMISEVTGRFVWLIGLFTVWQLSWGLLGVAVVTALASLIQVLLAWLLAGSRVSIRPIYQPRLWREIIIRSWPLAVTITLNLLYLRADILFLNWFKGEAVVGLYGAAYKVIDVLTSLPFLTIGLLLPLLTRNWANGQRSNFDSLVNRAISVLLVVVFPLIIGGQLLAGPIINLIAGPEFILAGPILALLLVAIAGIFASCLFNHILIAINRQQVMIRPYLIVAITAVPAYILLINWLSYWGAALVTVYSELLIAGLAAYRSKKLIGWRWPWRLILKVVLANFIMAIIIWPLRSWASQGIGQLLSLVLISMISYGLALVVLDVLTWQHWQEIIKPDDI
ncbi:flippase [Candidatus Falkowbacteria bacterium]|nr:flippase [Candidatus Falkowbacteria bacterium]